MTIELTNEEKWLLLEALARLSEESYNIYEVDKYVEINALKNKIATHKET